MTKKIMAILLAVTVVFALCGYTASAYTEAKAEVPVVLTVTNDYRKISVTVPASLPIEIYNGTVITANNAKITNNTKTDSVRVSAVTVEKGSFNIGSYDSFSNKNNTVALKINGVATKDSGKLEITDKSFPLIEPSKSINLEYFAKISGNVKSMNGKEIAQVVFTISTVR